MVGIGDIYQVCQAQAFQENKKMTRTAQKAYYVLNFKLRPIDPKSIVGLYVSFVFYWISFGFYIHDFSAKCRKRLNCLSRYHSNVTREGRISEPDSQKRC